MRLAIAVLVLAACAAPRAARQGPFVLGERVHTSGGLGYRVVTECVATYCVDVEGLGTRFFAGVPFQELVTDEARVRAEMERMRVLLMQTLKPLPSVHSSGFGGDCARRAAVVVFFDVPSDVDAAIARVGAWLAENQLRDTIHLCEMGQPTLLGERPAG